MPNYAEYFDKISYKPRYTIGDRVAGTWNKIPFRGSVGNDRLISEITGPEVVVHLDLPVLYQGKTHNILIVKHRQIRPVGELDVDPPQGTKNGSAKTVGRNKTNSRK